MNAKKSFYLLADLKVMSDYPLTYALEVEDAKSFDIEINNFSSAPQEVDGLCTKHEHGASMLYQYSEDSATFSYAGQGYFKVSKGKLIQYYLYSGYDDKFIIQTLLCQCMGAIFGQRKMIGVHSGVCYISNSAIVLCGQSGAGKTTLTAELLNRGAQFMADDTACITVDDTVLVHALVPLRKVCKDVFGLYPCDDDRIVTLPNEIKEKIGIRETDNFHRSPERVGAIFEIKVGNVDRVSIREITGIEKLIVLRKNLYAPGAYTYLLNDKDYFNKLTILLNSVPMFELIRPIEGNTVKKMAETVEGVARNLHAIKN